jgi:hypothetical protein
MPLANSGYLGGDVSMAERHRMRDKYIAPRLGVQLGLKAQCRCGGTVYVKWRKRWYCQKCARWVRTFGGHHAQD